MANNQYVNKVVFGDETLIDLSNDTIAANKMISGTTAHDKSGASVTGNIPTRTSSDITTYDEIETSNHRLYHIIDIPSGYYNSPAGVGYANIYIPIPESEYTYFEVDIPNGTLNPQKSNPDDWISLKLEVDSQGNATVTDDTIPANGVSF